jgi:hypothetical protein
MLNLILALDIDLFLDFLSYSNFFQCFFPLSRDLIQEFIYKKKEIFHICVPKVLLKCRSQTIYTPKNSKKTTTMYNFK